MRIATALPFVLLAACTGEQTSSSTSLTRAPFECSDIEVHVIGVSDGGGSSTVILRRPGRHILVLSAKDATTWNVEVEGEAELERVYAVGEQPQKVVTNVTAPVITESLAEGGAGANGYAYPDSRTDSLLKLASIRVDRHATSFHGCFAASNWVIGEDMLVTSDCGGSYVQYDAVTDCDGDNVCGEDGGEGGGDGDGDGGGNGGIL